MGAAKDIFDELEAMGAIGNKAPPAPAPEPEPSVSEVTLETGSPGAFRDTRGQKMVEYCERVVELLTVSIEIQQELRNIFIELHDLWVDEDGPGEGDTEEEEEEEEGEEEEEEEPAPPAASEETQVASSEPPAEEVQPEDIVPPAIPLTPPPMSARRSRFLDQMKADAEKKAPKNP